MHRAAMCASYRAIESTLGGTCTTPKRMLLVGGHVLHINLQHRQRPQERCALVPSERSGRGCAFSCETPERGVPPSSESWTSKKPSCRTFRTVSSYGARTRSNVSSPNMTVASVSPRPRNPRSQCHLRRERISISRDSCITASGRQKTASVQSPNQPPQTYSPPGMCRRLRRKRRCRPHSPGTHIAKEHDGTQPLLRAQADFCQMPWREFGCCSAFGG